jgi:hypothetical protein
VPAAAQQQQQQVAGMAEVAALMEQLPDADSADEQERRASHAAASTAGNILLTPAAAVAAGRLADISAQRVADLGALAALREAAAQQLQSLAPAQLAVLIWCLCTLDYQPPADWMERLVAAIDAQVTPPAWQQLPCSSARARSRSWLVPVPARGCPARLVRAAVQRCMLPSLITPAPLVLNTPHHAVLAHAPFDTAFDAMHACKPCCSCRP